MAVFSVAERSSSSRTDTHASTILSLVTAPRTTGVVGLTMEDEESELVEDKGRRADTGQNAVGLEGKLHSQHEHRDLYTGRQGYSMLSRPS